jgi:hypothetical protein
MAGRKISELFPADLLTGDELLPSVENGVVKKTTTTEFKSFSVDGLGTASLEDKEAFATAAQGLLAETALQPSTGVSTTTVANLTSSSTEPENKLVGDLWIDHAGIPSTTSYVSNDPYNTNWDATSDVMPSKNTMYDKVEGMYSDIVNVSAVDNIPVSGAVSDTISSNWAYNHLLLDHAKLNDIGLPGKLGFGVGVYPDVLPAGYSVLSGTDDKADNNYGNYLYSDGSVMCWIPAFYYRIGHADNPTYPGYSLNSIDIKSFDSFVDVAAANAAGYALHRAFYDGGAIKLGFFVDKYLCSNNVGVASSIRNGNPLSVMATHNSITMLVGVSVANNVGSCIAAAKTRGASFFCCSRFIHAALALLATAHGQAATNNTFCAWYLANKNYPKGNNNNVFSDVDDTTIAFQSDGFLKCSKTGSGSLFAKTTHNGQNSGVTDLNGTMWEVSIGMSCIAVTKSVEDITATNPCQITITNHGLSTGDVVQAILFSGMTPLNGKLYKITVTGPDTFTLDGVDSTSYGFFGSGSIITGTFYLAKTSVRMQDFTSSFTELTDHWGVDGILENMSPITLYFSTQMGSNEFAQRFGNLTEQVFDSSVSGDGMLLTCAGLPKAAGTSISGTNLFGSDYYYQSITDNLCVVSSGMWAHSAMAGVWCVSLAVEIGSSSYYYGFRSAAYV